MFLNSFILIFIGFCGGVGASAGTFAFMLVIRVIPRIIQKAKLSNRVMWIENMIMCGILFGTLFSLFDWERQLFFAVLGKILLIIFGASAGIFVGCTAVALAEILDTFPIFFRRLNISESANEKLLFCMAIGKTLGALFFFYFGYGLQGGT